MVTVCIIVMVYVAGMLLYILLNRHRIGRIEQREGCEFSDGYHVRVNLLGLICESFLWPLLLIEFVIEYVYDHANIIVDDAELLDSSKPEPVKKIEVTVGKIGETIYIGDSDANTNK